MTPKKPLFAAFALTFITFCAARAEEPTPADSSRVTDIEEVVVASSPKEHVRLRRQPLSATLFGADELRRRRAGSVKDLSAFAPNLYMPRYGSRAGAAAYIRGVGSRINTPAVGLYVDNIPYADKSAYDFDFLDVERVDVLRGPQGTLYGRGTMGGLLRVFTADPLQAHGSRVQVGGSTREGGRYASAGTVFHAGSSFALATSAYYKGSEGFRRNATTGHKADGGDAAGGRLRAAWKPRERLRFDYTASFAYSHERSNPYVYEGTPGAAEEPYPDLVGLISQNRPSTYTRRLLNTGLSAEWQARRFTLSSITAYQMLNDRLFMDMDYIRPDIFTLCQKQHGHTLSEELSLKGSTAVGSGPMRWEWTGGAFVLYDRKLTTCPVVFYADGVDYLNSMLGASMPRFVGLEFTDGALPFLARMHTEGANAALFHQSVLRNLLGARGLSLTLGLRLDADFHRLRLRAPARTYNYDFRMSMPAFGLDINEAFTADAAFGGRHRQHTLQLLPRVALQYDFAQGKVYASVSKGYRSGGYNLNGYNELSQSLLRRNILTTVRDYSCATIEAMPYLPDAAKQGALAGVTSTLNGLMPEAPAVGSLAYEPEYVWSHEVGVRLDLFGGALQIDAAAFGMMTHGLQMAQFAENGMGRMVVNAGKAQTWGMEAQARTRLLDNRLAMSAAYGLAHSTFSDYKPAEGTDLRSNAVPFAPRHTLALTAEFRQPLRRGPLLALAPGLDAHGAGRIYWDEANTFSQPFAMQLGAHLTAEWRHCICLTLWAKNLTRARFDTFAFDSMGRRYAQRCDPRHFGADLSVKF